MLPPLRLRFAAPLLLSVAALAVASGADEIIITTRQDSVGRLLNAWAKEKSAAGLKLIQYENRDGQHSALNVAQYPGLNVYQPTEEEKKSGHDKAAAYIVRQQPTVGNCSMAAHPTGGGSLPRLYYTQDGGLAFLNQQYLSNNLIIYPEHLDHDPGGNGIGGWGDLYPANTACLLISQGSSFTDQPFLNAVLSTIAAFDPDVLTMLIRKRILMPTVQAIFRQSNKMVKSEADYLTAKAHPVVFDGSQIDEEKMVLAAHTMTRAAVPPVAFVRVVSESSAKNGKDFFERSGITSEKLGDTPTAIARVFRSHDAVHEMTISAAGTADLLGRPSRLECRLLQGDPSLVSIETGDKPDEFRLRVKWHMPMITGTGIRSHRVDIGVFASNGVSTSAPAFITFYMLPNEVRSYDAKGRVLEVFYEAPNPDIGLPSVTTDARWLEVFRAITSKEENVPADLMQQVTSKALRAAVSKPLHDLTQRQHALDSLKKDETKKDAAAKLQSAFEQDIAATLAMALPGTEKITVRQAIERAFSQLADQTGLFASKQKPVEKLAASSSKTSAPSDLTAEVKRLIDLGVLIQDASGAVQTVHGADQLSSGERHLLRCLNLLVMSQVLYPKALERSTAAAFVDPRLSTPKAWRDVFRYDAKGAAAGWVRYHQGRTYVFDREGRLLPDGMVAPDKATAVSYRDDGKGRLTFLP